MQLSHSRLSLAAALAMLSLPLYAQTQADMNEQAGAEYEQADKRLNSAYAALAAKISEDGRTSLKQAEQAWIRFRDEECSFETMGSERGSAHSMVVAQCKLRLTKQRTKDLQDQANCEEGDLSCGGQ